jgi:hypothetical protein
MDHDFYEQVFEDFGSRSEPSDADRISPSYWQWPDAVQLHETCTSERGYLLEAQRDRHDSADLSDHFAPISHPGPWTGPYEMSRVDWRWAAQKGFFDPNTRQWNAAAGGYEAYARQRAELKARRGCKTAANSDQCVASSSQTELHAHRRAAITADFDGGSPSAGRDGANAANAGGGAAGRDGDLPTHGAAWSVERPLAFRTCSVAFDQALPAAPPAANYTPPLPQPPPAPS